MEELYEMNIFDVLTLKAKGQITSEQYRQYINATRFSDYF